MPFYMNGTCYYEGMNITREEFLERLGRLEGHQHLPAVSGGGSWSCGTRHFPRMRTSFIFRISSGLSGSCQTAMMLAQEEKYEGRVYVVDNGSVMPLHRSILDALELLESVQRGRSEGAQSR